MPKQILGFLLLLVGCNAHAAVNCHGRFVNPITHIAWETLFPLTVGGRTVADPGKNAKSTPREKKKPFCTCKVKLGALKVKMPGLPLGHWSYYRQLDITTKPYCMTSLGGMTMDLGVKAPQGTIVQRNGNGKNNKA